MKLYILKIYFALLLQLCASHKQTPFQGKNSLFSQDQLQRSFPFGIHQRIFPNMNVLSFAFSKYQVRRGWNETLHESKTEHQQPITHKRRK